MNTILRGVVLSLALTCAGVAASIDFSGTGIGGTGTFSEVGSGTTFNGTITVVSAGSDGILDNPNNGGRYSLLIGGIQVSVGGLGQFSFTEGEEVNVSINVLNSDEGTDGVEFEAQDPFFGSIVVTFFGDLTGNFVSAPVGDNGLDAVK
ncbi:MAG: hypothetical protein FJW36_08095 [Acidobacteria bacterium]|nr:hypothetical protein [Acidobacteriota bacterium]